MHSSTGATTDWRRSTRTGCSSGSRRSSVPCRAPPPDDRVDGVALRAVDVAQDRGRLLDLEPRQLCCDLFGGVEEVRVARPADPVREVRRVVPDEEERSARRHRAACRRMDVPTWVRRDVEVEEENEVERFLGWLVLDEVCADELRVDAVARGP